MHRSAAALPLLALFLGTTSAFADVTAEEVWADVRALMEGTGQTVTVGAEERSGDTLTVSDIVIDMAMPEGSSSASLDQIVFVERGDGTVEIQLSPEYRIVSTTRPPEGEPIEMRATMTHDGLSMVVSGDAETKTYTYSAAELGFNLSEMSSGGAPVPGSADVRLAGPSGSYVSRTESGGRAIDSTLDAASIKLVIAGTDETSGRFDFTMDFAEIASVSTAFLPLAADMADFPAALKAGFKATGELTHGASTFGFSGEMEGSQSQGSGTAAAGSFEFGIGADGLVYGGKSSDVDFTMKSSDIPLPEVAFGMDETAFRLAMPLNSSDTPQDFGLRTAIRGLTMSDGIWALFDPMANLPRDPATLAVDMTGQARWLVDILNPEAAAATDAPPAELASIEVTELEVTAVGASLTGTGSFTFDNADTTTFAGMPAPEGSADLRLTGGNGLLDKLVAMGLVPEDQATGFRMMLGIFAQPGASEDELVSKIEVTPDGQVLANGQRIR
jgi:hypothetical protein